MRINFKFLVILIFIFSGCGKKHLEVPSQVENEESNKVQILYKVENDEKINILNLEKPASYLIKTKFSNGNCQGTLNTRIILNEFQRFYLVSNILIGRKGCSNNDYRETYKVDIDKMENNYNFYGLKNYKHIFNREMDRVIFKSHEFFRLKITGNEWNQSYFFNSENGNLEFPFQYLLEDKETTIYSEFSLLDPSSNSWDDIEEEGPLSSDVVELVESFIFEHGF